MAELWAAHDRVARDLLAARGGREIDKTDGMLLLFDAATDALAYAADYHRALKALPVPLFARAGLHVGPVTAAREAIADATEFDRAWQEGRSTSLEQAITDALQPLGP